MENTRYVHGYSEREALRLKDQAATLDEIIHNDSVFPKGSIVLEAGCCVGAQTKIIATKNPYSDFISVDLSEASLNEAKEMIRLPGIGNKPIVTGNQCGSRHRPGKNLQNTGQPVK